MEWSTEAVLGVEDLEMSSREKNREANKDSGRGLTPAPGMAEMLQMVMEENR